jgi:hypothetical protein
VLHADDAGLVAWRGHVSFMLAAFIAGPTLSEAALGGLWFFGSVAGGACGLVALSQLLVRLLGQRRPVRRPAWVLAGLALGALPILPFALTSSLSDGGAFLTIAPLAATAHLVYLSRGMLFPRHDAAESREPAAARLAQRLATAPPRSTPGSDIV